MKTQNYIYQLTKQRTSQSMRMRGTKASFDKINDFLKLHAHGIEYKNASICYFAWIDADEEYNEAKVLEQKLFQDLNPQLDWNKDIPKINDQTKRILQWELGKGADEYTTYIDNLRIPLILSPRPVVQLVFSVDFWLNDAPNEASLVSSLIAWLSPASNLVDFYLNFPSLMNEKNFSNYRENLQKDCPVKIEDKYLHLRTIDLSR